MRKAPPTRKRSYVGMYDFLRMEINHTEATEDHGLVIDTSKMFDLNLKKSSYYYVQSESLLNISRTKIQRVLGNCLLLYHTKFKISTELLNQIRWQRFKSRVIVRINRDACVNTYPESSSPTNEFSLKWFC